MERKREAPRRARLVCELAGEAGAYRGMSLLPTERCRSSRSEFAQPGVGKFTGNAVVDARNVGSRAWIRPDFGAAIHGNSSRKMTARSI
jgi:hypothetical protein